MKYCTACGGAVGLRVPEGDSRERHVCLSCGLVHYQNPKIVTGCIPVWGERVLLCRRAIAPGRGAWTLPAGFMENGETSWQGAVRETLEEARARVAVDGPYTAFNLPHIDQVYLFFRAHLLDPDFAPGEESLEVALFGEAEIPWGALAFPVVTETLRFYFADRAAGVFRFRMGDITRQGGGQSGYRLSLL